MMGLCIDMQHGAGGVWRTVVLQDSLFPPVLQTKGLGSSGSTQGFNTPVLHHLVVLRVVAPASRTRPFASKGKAFFGYRERKVGR